MVQSLPDVPDPSPTELCDPFLRALPISGVSITVIAGSGAQLTVASSDAIAARIDELQFELGEGPHRTAASTGHVVQVANVQSHGFDEWPIFGAAIATLPVGAIICVPIRMGAVVLGVATLSSVLAQRLNDDQCDTALAIASAIAGTAVDAAVSMSGVEVPPDERAGWSDRREVHQATGMVLVQLDCTATIAYARLQAYAFAHGRTIHDVALDVVNGVLSFEDAAL